MATFEPVQSAIAEEISARPSLIQEKQPNRATSCRLNAGWLRPCRSAGRPCGEGHCARFDDERRRDPPERWYPTSPRWSRTCWWSTWTLSSRWTTRRSIHLFEAAHPGSRHCRSGRQRASAARDRQIGSDVQPVGRVRLDAVAFLRIDLAMHELMAEATGNPGLSCQPQPHGTLPAAAVLAPARACVRQPTTAPSWRHQGA